MPRKKKKTRMSTQFNLIQLNLGTVELKSLNPDFLTLFFFYLYSIYFVSVHVCLIWNDLPLGRQLNPSPPWEPEFFPYSTLYNCHFFYLFILFL